MLLWYRDVVYIYIYMYLCILYFSRVEIDVLITLRYSEGFFSLV